MLLYFYFLSHAFFALSDFTLIKLTQDCLILASIAITKNANQHKSNSKIDRLFIRRLPLLNGVVVLIPVSDATPYQPDLPGQ